MPDSFFTSSKPRKRKRAESGGRNTGSAGPPSKFVRKGPPSRDPKKHGASKANGAPKKRNKAADEELDSDRTDGEDGGIDDMDLRGDRDEDPGASGEEDEDETPAEKRLRLAKLYLESVKEGLGESPSSALPEWEYSIF